MKDKIQAEIDALIRKVDEHKGQIVLADGAVQALRWVLKEIEAADTKAGEANGD